MSGQEIFVIIIVALLLFGADKLPEIAKGIGKGMRDFRKATDDIKREFEESTKDIRQDFNEVTTSIKNEVTDFSSKIESDMTEATDNIKKEVNGVAENIQNDLNEVSGNINRDINAVTQENEPDTLSNVQNTPGTGSSDQPQGKGDTENTQGASTYKRTINEPDDNYYRYDYTD